MQYYLKANWTEHKAIVQFVSKVYWKLVQQNFFNTKMVQQPTDEPHHKAILLHLSS